MGEDGFIIIEDGTRDKLIREMKQRGVTCCIEPAIDVDSNERLLRLSSENEGFLFPAVGNHPTRCIHSPIRDFQRVREFSKDKHIVAIGETGLDYHYDRWEQHRFRQKIWFLWQIRLAHQLGLPLILHIRMADRDAIRILRRNKSRLHGGVCHCFQSGLETDGPYVRPQKPEGISGKKWQKARNTSLILPAVAEKIAELKGLSTEEVLCAAEENTRRVFGTEERRQ